MANEDIKSLFNKMFEDKNNNGVPDMFEQQSADGKHNFQVFSTEKVNVNGQDYKSLDDLPLALREKLKDAFSMVSKNKWMNTVVGTALDFMPEIGMSNQTNTSAAKISGDEFETSTEIPSNNHFNFRINKKWIYAIGIIVVIFILWRFL